MRISDSTGWPEVSRVLAIGTVALLALGTARCVKEFDPASKLGEHIQVLGIQAAPPGIQPGEQVDLTALVYLPQDWTEPLDALWLTCLPEIGETTQACLETVFAQFGAPLGSCQMQCENDPNPDVCLEDCLFTEMLQFICSPDIPQKGCIAAWGADADYTLPVGAFPDDGEEYTFYVFVMATALEGGLSTCFDTWGEQVLAGDPMGPTADCTLSMKRVTVYGDESEPVSNPGLEQLTAAGEPVPPSPDFLIVELPEPDPENNVIDLEATLDATATESIDQVYLSWFADCGTLDRSRTFGDDPINALTPDRTGPCQVYVVVRNDKNGVGWIERTLQVEVAGSRN